ncbi:MAG TPA: hypothetical protein VF021_12680 [Longimicrobiales bacterium]
MSKPKLNAPSWLTGKADAASLPALLENLGTQVDPSAVDELWLFPMRRVAGVESTVFVLSLLEPDERRRVITAHVRTTRNKRGEPNIETRLDEHATAPAERLPRVIEGVLKRLSDDYASTPPSHAHISCSPERWHALVEVLTSAKPTEPLPESLLPGDRPATASAAHAPVETGQEESALEPRDGEAHVDS